MFENIQEFDKEVDGGERKICLGINFKSINTETFDYDV